MLIKLGAKILSMEKEEQMIITMKRPLKIKNMIIKIQAMKS